MLLTGWKQGRDTKSRDLLPPLSMCKQQRVDGGTHMEQITKAGFDATRRLKTGELMYRDERRDGDACVRLVEVSLLLPFTAKTSTVVAPMH